MTAFNYANLRLNAEMELRAVQSIYPYISLLKVDYNYIFKIIIVILLYYDAFFCMEKRTPATKSPLPTSAERFVCQRLAAFGCAERRADPFRQRGSVFLRKSPWFKTVEFVFSNQRKLGDLHQECFH